MQDPLVLTTADLFTAVVGFFMPLLIALVNRLHWRAEVKGLVAFVACIIVAAVKLIVVDQVFDPADWVRSILILFFVAISTYHFWWKPSNIAPRIESATSSKPPDKEPVKLKRRKPSTSGLTPHG